MPPCPSHPPPLQGQKKARAILSQLAVARLQQLAGLNLPVMLMYLPVHFFFALWVSSFTFLPLKAAAAGWAAFLVPYYVATSLGEPHHTGGGRVCVWRGGGQWVSHAVCGVWRCCCKGRSSCRLSGSCCAFSLM